jgi:hypothetical protein
MPFSSTLSGTFQVSSNQYSLRMRHYGGRNETVLDMSRNSTSLRSGHPDNLD